MSTKKPTHSDDAIPVQSWLGKPVAYIPEGSLATLRGQAKSCRACPLWRRATQTMFGLGSARAKAVLVGEQPGAQEDVAGQPFVGPAGELLRRTMEAAGMDAKEIFLTNAVKHLKYERRGKNRLHKRANADEQAACRPWLAAELLRIKPALVLALGATAAQTLFGPTFKLTRQRGRWTSITPSVQGMATWHPSAILRMPSPGRAQALKQFQCDISEFSEALRKL